MVLNVARLLMVLWIAYGLLLIFAPGIVHSSTRLELPVFSYLGRGQELGRGQCVLCTECLPPAITNPDAFGILSAR